MNKIIISGRTTKPIELKVSQNGRKFAFFSIAVNEGKDNEGNELTSFFDCKAFEKTAEFLSGITSAELLGLTGRLHQNNFTSQNGEKRSKVEIIVDTVEVILWGKKEEKEEPKHSYKPEDIDLPTDLPF